MPELRTPRVFVSPTRSLNPKLDADWLSFGIQSRYSVVTKKIPVIDPSKLSKEELAKHANRLMLLSKDAERVCDFLDKLFDVWTSGHDTKGILHDALMTSAVTVYARSFIKNEVPDGEATARAAFALLPVSENDCLKELHDQIIEARNKAVAHSDWSRRTTRVIETGLPGSLRSSSLAAGWEHIPERRFRELAHRVWDESRQLVSRIDRGEHPFNPNNEN